MQTSVILCTHNPRRDFLERVLRGLREQSLPATEWELLVVDNQSDSLVKIDLVWHPHAQVVREEQLGLSTARARGISESRGGLLVFVDDDNVLDPNYLEQAVRIAAQWPQLGIWGGSAIGEFEVQPSPAVEPHLHCLALREVKTQQWSNSWSSQEAEPHGAGLCIRREAALAYRDFYLGSQLKLSDRSGRALLSGGDTEMAFFVCSLGLGMGVFPELSLKHLIPASRLTEDYIARIAEGLETSSMLLFYKWGKTMPRSTFALSSLLRFLKHALFSRGLERKLALGRLRAMRAARRMIRAESRSAGLLSGLSAREA